MELNPDHPVTQDLRDHWSKVLAMVMKKCGLSEVMITEADFKSLETGQKMPCVIAHSRADGLLIKLLPKDEAMQYVNLVEGKAEGSA